MQAIYRIYEYQDWITITFLICFVLIVLAKILFPQRFEDFLSLLTSGKFIAFKGKENKAFHGFNILLLTIQSLAISMFLYLCYDYYFESDLAVPILYIRILTAYVCIILIKTGVEKIIGNIFEIDDQVDYYIFQKFTYRSFIAICLLCISLLLTYSVNLNSLLLSLTGGLALIANGLGMFIIYRRNQNVLIVNWFYFILYLCALEIAPYIILYKLITI
ncbi:DUF4271 domain-containing protein [Christiangramia aquimixticola]|uniref:DUF4271 domain-containing protein n=1 Tax=Christiangramia aquimixticola TaxID=1697558 RepID=UPI003AA7B234